jgi:hypothetical protein
MAGQHIEAGTIRVSNDEENLYVTYTTTDEWQLSETHLAVAKTLSGIPQNKNNMIPGQFPYKAYHNPTVSTWKYTISLSSLNVAAGQTLYIAAHAVVEKLEDDIFMEETAWGEGYRFGKSWGMYFEYIVQACNNGEEQCTYGGSETAWAVGTSFGGTNPAGKGKSQGGGNAHYVTYNRIGTQTYNLGAGANYFKVGTLTVSIVGDNLKVIYQADSGYTFKEVHLHVGDTVPTIAIPGQFAYKFTSTDYFETKTFTIPLSSLGDGTIYIAAHAAVHSVTCPTN